MLLENIVQLHKSNVAVCRPDGRNQEGQNGSHSAYRHAATQHTCDPVR
jgi:predicted RNA binding protein YcfA (HicA-like mRNA interferase family)